MKNTFAIAMSAYAFGLMSGCATQPGRSASSPAPALTTEEQSSIKATVQELITSKKIPGAIVIVVQDGKAVFEDAAGASSANSTNPARMDTVIWLASMTKPIVATSILMLAEQGKLSIDDPVSKYIPEFAAIPKVKVAKPGAASPAQGSQPEFNLVDAKRTITIKDLLTHTSGLLPIGPGSVPKLGAADTLATAVPRLANVALSNQPGEKWGYSNSAGFDVLARIVEVVSGQNFKAFAQQHVLTPLGMKDTNWAPQTDARAPRMATSPTADGPNPTREGVTYFSGAAGLWGTLPDYSRFAQMLANGGALNGKRYLKPESVALMTRNHVGALYTGTNSGANGKPGFGFGLSVATVEDNAASGLAVPNRSFGWNGAGGTKFWVSPAEHKRILVMYAPNGEAQGRIEKAVDDALKD